MKIVTPLQDLDEARRNGGSKREKWSHICAISLNVLKSHLKTFNHIKILFYSRKRISSKDSPIFTVAVHF